MLRKRFSVVGLLLAAAPDRRWCCFLRQTKALLACRWSRTRVAARPCIFWCQGKVSGYCPCRPRQQRLRHRPLCQTPHGTRQSLLLALQHLHGLGDDLCRCQREDRDRDGGGLAFRLAAGGTSSGICCPGNQASRQRQRRGLSVEEGYQLVVANRLWGQTGYTFLPTFLQITRNAYGAELGARWTSAARRKPDRPSTLG